MKAAELLAGSWRPTLNAATMLCLSKTAYQAEIDSACELIDFLRFNVYFMQEMYEEQPISTNGVWNRIDYRPLEGFVLAITPFNFTAIGGNLPTALIRGAFEYQGQKCSAASKAYIPRSIWGGLKDRLLEQLRTIKMGDVEDFTNFMGAVVDRKSFLNVKKYIEYAGQASDAKIFYGGRCDDSVGYFVEPTVIFTSNPRFKTMKEEIFGPVLTIYVYDDNALEETLNLCDTTSPYGLTGAIFARDRGAVASIEQRLRRSAGNLYINDKPTGAVVGQQPFGGGRASGTNDKAGSKLNLLRWVNPRTIKETFVPSKSYTYPYMTEE